MSITSAKTGASGISLALDNNYMEPIASILVGAGGNNSVMFTDIPQRYKHLQIRGILRAGGSGLSSAGTYGVYGIINNDQALNYTNHVLYGNGSSVNAGGAGNVGYASIVNYPGFGATANAWGGFICDILDYSNTNKYKALRTIGGYEGNDTNGIVTLRSDLWMSTNPITSIMFSASGNSGSLSIYSFAQYSRISLYGIKG